VSAAVGGAAPAVARPPAVGIALLDAPTRDVSSTEIRRRLGSGLSIADLVPGTVRIYIEQHGLYTRHSTNATLGRSLA
jgi:nicotinic acid mononucleotide adenylyltransferase